MRYKSSSLGIVVEFDSMPRPPLRPGKASSAPSNAKASTAPGASETTQNAPMDAQPTSSQEAVGQESEHAQPSTATAREELKKDPGLQAAVDPHKLPPRITLLPIDYALCLLIPSPMFAYHSGDRRFIWPVALCEFVAMCCWFYTTNPLFSDNLPDTKDSFVVDPIKNGWRLLKDVKFNSVQALFRKNTAVLVAIILHLAVIGMALWKTWSASRRQRNAVFVLRPVHLTDFALLVVDDTTMSALHAPSRVSLGIRSLMRVVLLFGFFPQTVAHAVAERTTEYLSILNGIRFAVHVGLSGYFLTQHMKVAGRTSVF